MARSHLTLAALATSAVPGLDIVETASFGGAGGDFDCALLTGRDGKHWLAADRSVVVFSLVPTCAGPPPGYFGAGDAGLCYRIDTPDVRVIPAKDCF